MTTAAIKFKQGVTTAPAGQALIGALGSSVTASNGDDTDVGAWEWEWRSTPTGSALVAGIITSGKVPTIAFTPDVTGTYVLVLRVYDKNGRVREDVRCFGVNETAGTFAGLLMPNFDADQGSMNFGGQKKGWHPYIEAWLRAAGGGGGDPCGSHFVDTTNQTTAQWQDGACTDGTAASPQNKVWSRRKQLRISTDAANQVIDDGGSFGGVDFTIPQKSTVKVCVTVAIKLVGNLNGGTVSLSGTFIRHTGAASRITSPDDAPVYALTSYADSPPRAMDLNLNANKVEVRYTPPGFDDTILTVVRTHTIVTEP